ncbi:MAG: endonuclease/exonuclease/phosphatase family protein, partial [Bacteroidetes bacterium]|nr:endonuclease/exonuclease/phosphatase family protein [Bacteroidota bacterium]
MSLNSDLDGTRGKKLLDISLKVATLNVRGFKNKKKKQALLKTFKRDNLDIIAIQETYIEDEQGMNEVNSLWGGLSHFSPGTGRGKGLITLFHSKYKTNDINLVFKSDRILISSIVLDGQKLFIINVYAPCLEQEKITFLNTLYNAINSYVGVENVANSICLGDFNIALQSLDVLKGEPHKETICREFQNLIQNVGFVDTWRSLHMEEKQFTWSKINPPCAKRLDYVFIGEAFVDFLSTSLIKSVGFSDHRMVVSVLNFSTFKYGKGLYKINTSLFRDQNYCSMMVKIIN